MFIQYGTVVMEFIDTNEVKKEQVLTSDNTDYVYTKWTIDVNCLFAPASHTTNYSGDFATGGAAHVKEPGNVNPFGVGQPSTGGALPNLTDRSIRHYLFQPRRLLTIWSDFEGEEPFLILQSPWIPGDPLAREGTRCSSPDVDLPDELNGPFVEACDVVECKGVRSWWVRIRIITYVNECGGQFSKNSPNPISAHRWKRWVNTDEDYFTALITEGEVVFRPAVMITTNSWPDQYRANFFPPIDPTMRRDKIEVMPSSDGTRVNYRVTDQELAFSIGQKCPATRIECLQTGGYSRLSHQQAAWDWANGILSSFTGNSGKKSIPGAVTQMVASGLSLVSRLTPKFYDHVVVKVWGNRNSKKFTLLQLAFAVAFQRLSPLSLAQTTELMATIDVTGKYVELLMTYRSGPEQARRILIAPGNVQRIVLHTMFSNLFGGPLAMEGDFAFSANGYGEDTVNTPGVTIEASDGSFVPGPGATISGSPPPVVPGGKTWAFGNPPPPNSNASRGTWRGKLVAQALAYPCGCLVPLGPSHQSTAPYIPDPNLGNANATPNVIIYNPDGTPMVPQTNPPGFSDS